MLDSNVDSHGIIEGCRKTEVEAISGARWLALRGPADHHELLAVQAFHFKPQAAIAGRVGRIGALRDDPLQLQGAGMVVEGPAAPDLMIAVLQRRAGVRQQFVEALLPLRKRPRADGLVIEVQEVEQEKDQGLGVARVGRGLNQAERGRAVGIRRGVRTVYQLRRMRNRSATKLGS
jgi:hypothetical protein